MKKIFAYIFAVAAFASCSNDINDVVAVESNLTSPVEIAVVESRAFDGELNWSWEATDEIAAYQNEGAKSVNTLALNEEGNFYNEAFVYASEQASAFHFVYPASQLSADYSLSAVQSGEWTPVLYGTVENATVSSIGSVEMNYLSSAFEVRVWEAGRTARKSIVKAALSSESDFVPTWSVNEELTYTQSFAGKELALDLNGDTAIFNLGEGDFAFTLTLTDASGATLSVPVSKNFVAGKRTILNVEWKSASVTSWYEDYANNNNTSLEGGVIYVTAEGGDVVVTINGAETEVVDGKIAGLASGVYAVTVSVAGNELVNRNVVVTSIPTLSLNVRTSYSNNGAMDTTNDIGGSEMRVSGVSLSDEYVAANLVGGKAYSFYYNTTAVNGTLGRDIGTMNLGWGEYNCYAELTLNNGYKVKSAEYTTHITGVPYHADWRSADYPDWSYVNISDNGSKLQVANGKLACIISPAFHAPNGSLAVKAAIAASTNATSAGNYDKHYIYVGNKNSSATESGTYVTNTYVADFGGLVEDASLKTADATFTLTSSNPCMVFTAKDYTVFLLGTTINTYVFQTQITY